MKKIKSWILLGFLLSMSVVSISIISRPLHLTGLQNASTGLSSFIPHGAITITGNADFVTQGWPGDGSPQSPYIIENLEIVTDSIGMSIANTDVHFIIRNCTVSSLTTGVGTGIFFSNVSNGTVENCTISSLDTGLSATSIEDSTFSNNTLTDIFTYGIYLSSSINCTVSDNKAINCEGYGFFLFNLRFSLVENNYVSNSGEMGFAFASSRNVTIVNNIIKDGGRFGLYLTMSVNCTFTNNTLDNGGFGFGATSRVYWNHYFSENTINGKQFGYFIELNDTEIDGGQFGQVFLIYSFNVSLSSGVFFNASVGVSLFSSVNCTISDTVLSGHRYGINLLQSENTTLTNNTLIDCGIRLDGDATEYWSITATGNTINGKQFGYFLNQVDLVINGDDYGQLVLVESDHLVISNGTFDSVTVGLMTFNSYNCSINDAVFADNYYGGIRLLNSPNCTLTNVTSSGYRSSGLYLHMSDNTTVTESEFHGHSAGIWVSGSDNFLFESNQIHDNRGNPIYLSGTNYGIIRNNSIHDNGDSLRLYIVNWLEIINNTISGSLTDGLYMDFTSGVVIVGNKIYGHVGYGLNVRSNALFSEIYKNMIGFNEAGNAVDSAIFSEWDDGISTGNVWSDYSGVGVYSVSGVGVDNYPLGFLSWQDNVQYVVGSVVPEVTWDVRLPNPDSYTVLWDGVDIAQGSLNSSLDYISKTIEGLSVGSYNLTLVVNDESGYSLVDTVIITVIAQTTTITTTTTTTTTTTSTTTTSTGTTSTTTSTTSPPPPDSSMILIVGVVGVIGVIVVLIVVIRKR